MATSTTPVSIRPAERRDCPAIADLIKELDKLPIYEKMGLKSLPGEIKITAKDLERDAFDSNPPYFHCLVAEDSSLGTVIGYALYYYSYSTRLGKAIFLEDLYINSTYRQHGLGSKFLQRLAQIAIDGGFCRISFECLEANESAMKFYERHHAVNVTKRDGWHGLRFTADVLPKLAAGQTISS